MNLSSKIAIRLIRTYQHNGGGKRFFMVDCNYEPSCSEYMAQAIYRYGFFYGFYLGIKRIRRCNKKDVIEIIFDPIPENKKGNKGLIMKKKEEIKAKEIELQNEIRQLSDEGRKKFYIMAGDRIKDPDTYAVVSYFFMAGVHHFYLGNYGNGFLIFSLLSISIILFFTEYFVVGVLLIIGIVIEGAYNLFFAQHIVEKHNNNVMEQCLKKIR